MTYRNSQAALESQRPRDYPGESIDQDRISLSSIPARLFGWHLGAFSVSSLLLLAVRVYNGIVTAGGDPNWHQVIELIGAKGGSTMAACVGFSAIAVEGGNRMLGELFKRRIRREGYAEGRNKGFSDGEEVMSLRWQEWLRRKEAAESTGEPFDEPPPTPQNGLLQES
jgi:hypothetical protein